MSKTCLTLDEIKKVRETIMKNGGASALVEMTPEQLVNFFSKSVGNTEMAIHMSKAFSNAVISKRKGALRAWATKHLQPHEQSEVIDTDSQKKELNEKYEAILENKALAIQDETIMDSLIERLEGMELTETDTAFVNEQVAILQREVEKDTDNLSGMTDEYWEAKMKLNDYIQSFSPETKVGFVAKSWWRTMMLISPSSSIVSNVIFNVPTGLTEAILRRFGTTMGEKGSIKLLRLKYGLEALRIWNKYKVDITRVDYSANIIQSVVVGEHIKSTDHLVGHQIPHIVLHNLIGSGDLAFSAVARADSDILNARKMADAFFIDKKPSKKEYVEKVDDYTRRLLMLNWEKATGGLTDTEIELLNQYKQISVNDAKYVTYQQNNPITEKAIELRRWLDSARVAGVEIPAGTIAVPFLAIPANVLYMGVVDYSPIAIFRAMSKNKEAETMLEKHEVSMMIRRGITGTILQALTLLWLDDDDFLFHMPYEVASKVQREFVGRYDVFSIGGYLVSADYLGVLGAGLKVSAGLKSSKDISDMFDILLSVGYDHPMVASIMGMGEYIHQVKEYGKTKESFAGDVTTFGVSRFLPFYLLKYITGVKGKTMRRNDYLSWYGRIQSIVPDWLANFTGMKGRKDLPARHTITGEPRPEEGLLRLVFGSRISKDVLSNDKVKELLALDKRGDGEINISLYSTKQYKTLREMYEEDLVAIQEINDIFTLADSAYKKMIGDYIFSLEYKMDTDYERKMKIQKMRSKAFDTFAIDIAMQNRMNMYTDEKKLKQRFERYGH